MNHSASASDRSVPANPAWMGWTLKAAGVYNIVWGASVILFPHFFFDVLGIPRLEGTAIAIWGCVGMVIGVYGVGYWCAARDVARHWPIVLVGFLGKIFGPLGYVDAALIRGTFPVEFGWTLITNDLIWWVPFALMLRHAWRVNRR